MKRLLLGILVAGASLTAMADDYSYLTASYNGQEQSFELATIKKITFESGNVVVITTQGTVRLPQSEMRKMFFSATPTAIESLPISAKGLAIQSGLLNASGKGLLYIYSSNGTLLHMAHVDGNTNVSLSNLPKGVYIATMGKNTIKFTR